MSKLIGLLSGSAGNYERCSDREKSCECVPHIDNRFHGNLCSFHHYGTLPKGGMYYGLNALSRNLIFFNRYSLKAPNGVILGTPVPERVLQQSAK